MVSNFLFHRVSPERDPYWDPMDVGLFDRCMRFVSRHYKVMTIEDVIAAGHAFDGEKVATVQFDDGYKDNIVHAAPILAKYGIRASFYLVTNCIDKGCLTWTHLLRHILQHTSRKTLDLPFDFIPEGLRTSSFKKEERMDVINRLRSIFRKMNHDQRTLVLDHIQRVYDDVKVPAMMMDWDDIKSLHAQGHEIGSHTHTHPMLASMSRDEDILYELDTSRDFILRKAGIRPRLLAYPIGSYNDHVKKLTKQSGYEGGLAVRHAVQTDFTDPYEIPRIELYNETWFKTWLRMTNRLETIKKAVGYKLLKRLAS